MKTIALPTLSPDAIRVMTGALAEAHLEDEHELPRAVRLHEEVRRWWQALGRALSRGLEGSQVRALLAVQISLCGADAIFLQVALDNAADAPHPEDVDKARAALAEAREIEAKARDWLGFASRPLGVPAEE